MADETRTIHITTNLHIIAARAEVRSLARALGFSTMDQARISLATSTLAHMLDLGGRHDGQIAFSEMNGHDRDGQKVALQVTCTARCGSTATPSSLLRDGDLKKLQMMVDDLHVTALPSQDVQVRLVKHKNGT